VDVCEECGEGLFPGTQVQKNAAHQKRRLLYAILNYNKDYTNGLKSKKEGEYLLPYLYLSKSLIVTIVAAL
jgi:hypothetical protein